MHEGRPIGVDDPHVRFIFIRHGQVTWVGDGGAASADPTLSEIGLQQAACARQVLEDFAPTQVLVSDAVRSVATARIALGREVLPREFAPWLREIRYPDWSMAGRSEILGALRRARRSGFEERDTAFVEGGGELLSTFSSRVAGGMETLLGALALRRASGSPLWGSPVPGEGRQHRVAVIAHQGSISVAICCLLGIALTAMSWETFRLPLGAYAVVEDVQVGLNRAFVVVTSGAVDHMPEDLRCWR